jgi:hypothetical protein
VASSPSWCSHHIEAALAGLRRASQVVLKEPTELLARELQGALDQLGEMTEQFRRTIYLIGFSAGSALIAWAEWAKEARSK